MMKVHLPGADTVLMAVDIGGSKYLPGFLDTKGNILAQERREWRKVTQEAIEEQIVSALRELCARYPGLAARAKAGGLTIPGFADPVTGVWVDSDFLVVRNLPICDLLSREFSIPFFADNDCNACALAEKYFGGAKDCEHFLYLTVSTGIGGAIYLNGKLHSGAFQHAGEIGLCILEENGRRSDSGSVRGPLEMHASGRGLSRNFIEAGGPESMDGKMPGGPEISRLAEEGDPAALTALDREGRYLGRAIGDASCFLDPEKVIIGGGLSLLFHQYGEALQREYRHVCPDGKAVIEPTTLGYSGALLGAGAVARRGIEGFPGMSVSSAAQACTIRVDFDGCIRCSLELEEGPVSGFSGNAGAMGRYLVADGIGDSGTTLDKMFSADGLKVLWQKAGGTKAEEPQNFDGLLRLIRKGSVPAKSVFDTLGDSLGRAIAYACVLLDPSEVHLEGGLSSACRYLYPALEAAVKRETYYRGNLPFRIVCSDHQSP